MVKDFQRTPEEVEAAFYDAFARLDLELMSAVWLGGSRPLCIHPGGPLLQGKGPILESWRGIFDGTAPPFIEHRLIDSFLSVELCVHLVEERIRPRNTPPERASRVIATNVYVRRDGAWYMIEHHGSLPLVEEPNPSTRSIH